MRLGSTSPLTVVLALTTGLAVGSHPAFEPLRWARALLERSAEAANAAPSVAAATPARVEEGRSGAQTEELELLRKAEPALFPSLFGPSPNGAGTPRPLALPPLDHLSDLDEPDIVVPSEPEIATYLGFFTKSEAGRSLVERWLGRRDRYRPVVERSLAEAELPRALEAVVLAESGYHPRATSPAGAVGLWQLMPQTARSYGLRVEAGYDERRDPSAGSSAAVKHLEMLRAELGSWELVLAAYNAGQRRVEEAMAYAGTREYWQLSRTPGALPRETVLYVPKVLALAVVLENLDTFGLKAPAPASVAATAPSASSASSAPGRALPGSPAPVGVQWLGVGGPRAPSSLELFEPPAPVESHAIVIAPSAALARSERSRSIALDAASDDTANDAAWVPDLGAAAGLDGAGPAFARRYRVVPGDTLSKIAVEFGVEPASIARFNGLDDVSLVRIGQELQIPEAGAEAETRSRDAQVTVYLASPGDTVSKIARAYGISERELVLENDLKDPGYVREGQILRIRVPRAQARAYLERR